MGEFTDRLRLLQQNVGDGQLQGEISVDQIYAHYQHEHLWFNHPRGGMARYLAIPLFDGADAFYAEIARRFLDEDGNGCQKAMIDEMQGLNRRMHDSAPIEFDNLRNSGELWVRHNGTEVYHRPPDQRRLTEEELKELRRQHGLAGLGAVV